MNRRFGSTPCYRLLRVATLVGLLLSPALATRGKAVEVDFPTRESALRQLRTARDPRSFFIPPFPVTQPVYSWWNGCDDSFLFLSKLDGDVDDELEKLTTDENPIDVRSRGMKALVMRGSEKGIRVAAKWMRSDDRAERFAAWTSLRPCPNADVIWRVLTPEAALDFYRAEQDSTVRREIALVFGKHKARFAVDTLCRVVTDENHRFGAHEACFALGEIGDPRAIESLIRSRLPSRSIISALVRIADPKGADFVIDHFNFSGALALARIGGPHALPALERERDHLRYREVFEDRESLKDQIDEVELAMSLLKSKDPQSAWMDVAEESKDCLDIRELALKELERIGTARVRPRFLAFYRSKMNTYLGINCISVALRDDSAEVTDAMKAHYSLLRGLSEKASLEADDSTLDPASCRSAEAMLFHVLHMRIGNEAFKLRRPAPQ